MKYINLLLVILTFSCAEKGIVESYPNGEKKKEIQSLTDSTYLERRYYQNGKLKAEINYKDSIKNGYSTVYLEDGKYYQLLYKNNVANINWEYFEENGNPIEVSRELQIVAPNQITSGSRLDGYAKIVNSSSDSLYAAICCDIDQSGFPYSKCAFAGEYPNGKCDGLIPLEGDSAIISFGVGKKIRKMSQGIIMYEMIFDEIFLPYHAELTYEVVKDESTTYANE